MRTLKLCRALKLFICNDLQEKQFVSNSDNEWNEFVGKNDYLIALESHPHNLQGAMVAQTKVGNKEQLLKQLKLLLGPQFSTCSLTFVTRASVNGKPESENATVFLAKRGVMVPGV